MKTISNHFAFLLLICFAVACGPQSSVDNNVVAEPLVEVKTAAFHLVKPTEAPAAVLVLFGGFPQYAEDIQREFDILETAGQKGVAVVFLNYNQRLWLEEVEKAQLAQHLEGLFADNALPKANVYLGGYSSGGNIALLIGDYLAANPEYQLSPAGIFVVDSPVDLAELYANARKNVARNFSAVSVQEGKWLLGLMGNAFGEPETHAETYARYSVFTTKIGDIRNIAHLQNVPIRLYTEPDTVWWKENRKADYEQMNAYHLKKLHERLTEAEFSNVALITTKNRGYRANGERHPHSWSIVDREQLIEWMIGDDRE